MRLVVTREGRYTVVLWSSHQRVEVMNRPLFDFRKLLFRAGMTVRENELIKKIESKKFTCIEIYIKTFGIPKALLHCGAHLGEENEQYIDLGIKKISYVEAQPTLVQKLCYEFGEKNVYSGCLFEESGREIDFHLTSNSLSSSIRPIDEKNKWGIHNSSKIKLVSTTLNDVARDYFLRNRQLPEIIILDLQGSEYEALKGGTFFLHRGTPIILEYCTYELYKGMWLFSDIVNLLSTYGYQFVYKYGTESEGEALFVHDSEVDFAKIKRIQILTKGRTQKIIFARLIKIMFAKLSFELVRLSKFGARK